MFNVVLTVDFPVDVPALLMSRVPLLTFRAAPANGAARVLVPLLLIAVVPVRVPRPETVCPFRLTFLALALLAASTRFSGASIRKLAAEPAENATLVNEVAATTSNVPAVVVALVLIVPVPPPVCEKLAPSNLIRPLAPGFMVMAPGTLMLPFRSSVLPAARRRPGLHQARYRRRCRHRLSAFRRSP